MNRRRTAWSAAGLLLPMGLGGTIARDASGTPMQPHTTVKQPAAVLPPLFALLPRQASSQAVPTGSIRGLVIDSDFDAPLPAVRVLIVESGAEVLSSDDGVFLFPEVPPGRYTIVISKDGYTRQIRSNVLVTAARMSELNIEMTGDFTDMEPFVVQDLVIGGGDRALLQLRLESPALIDAISSELMSRAGAGDAASALTLVAGASVQDGKFAVIRGLPDRYVSSQLNGIRLPTADENKRAVQLDQFPSAAIQNIQVSKTFTPDQQGDASGGAVNIVLKGIPDETFVSFSNQLSFNTQVRQRADFLTYQGGGVNFWGRDSGGRSLDEDGLPRLGAAVGTSLGEAPIDWKSSLAAGSSHEFDSGLRIGGFASFFYERDSSYSENGIDDAYWVRNPGDPMTPQFSQGTPEDGDFKTSLFDVTRSAQSVQWGGLGTFGAEFWGQSISMSYLYTHIGEDKAILAQDTRGKEFFFPGYDPLDSANEGNSVANRFAAPYLRTETLDYSERTTRTFILNGRHVLPFFDEDEFRWDDQFIQLLSPELDWTLAVSDARLLQPDKRQFGALWLPQSESPGFPPFVPPFTIPAEWRQFKPAANFLVGNYQRIFKEIEEESDQHAINLKLPFRQWTDSDGYLKFGVFRDEVRRTFQQDTFSNLNENDASYQGSFDESWSTIFALEDRVLSNGPPFTDVDYVGNQRISAYYGMADVPLTSQFKVIGGVRVEKTRLGIVNDPGADAKWFPPGAVAPVDLNPGDADVDFEQRDVLPSIGFIYEPVRGLSLRGSYSRTVARQTFKELSPIQQQEFLGGDVFIGNPELVMSALSNYDLRVDWTPYEGGLLSASWFRKNLRNPIENVQRVRGFTYTTPVNYPTGRLTGLEFEARQDMGRLWAPLNGLTLGANLTLIDSVVTLPEDEAAALELPGILAPMPTRDMTNAPEYLYNLFFTYDFQPTGTQFGLFYSFRGDTLIAGAGQSSGNFVPNVYELGYGTLNFTLTQRIGPHLKFSFQAKNLTDPSFDTVYRSQYSGPDVLKTSYTSGIDYSIGISAEFTF